MLIHGFAYSAEENSEADRRLKLINRLNELNFMHFVKLTGSTVEYAKHRYTGQVDPAFGHPVDAETLLIWLDGWGMAPFGGTINYDPETGIFDAVVYTD